VEKDFNFYVSTPIKNKIFTRNTDTLLKTTPLNLNLATQSQTTSTSTSDLGPIDFYNSYERKYKDSLGEGSVKSKVQVNSLSGSYFSTVNNLDLNSIFSEYAGTRKYFTKNVKNVIKTVEDLEAPTNL
jgi:hypothetical protein